MVPLFTLMCFIFRNPLNSVSDSFYMLLTQHCDVTLIYRPRALLCITPIIGKMGLSAHCALKGWDGLRWKHWGIVDVSVACCRSCQMCEVLLLHPSCRERCLASGNTDSLALWLNKGWLRNLTPPLEKLQYSSLLSSFKLALYYCVWNTKYYWKSSTAPPENSKVLCTLFISWCTQVI